MDAVQEIIKKQKEATKHAKLLVKHRLYTREELSLELGISAPTLRKRLRKHNWKLAEIRLVLNIAPF